MDSKYIYEQDCSEDKVLISKLIDKINKWSNSLPHHPYKNFGNKIKIESVLYSPSYPALLDTQFEKRSKSKEFIPYDNRKIPERKYYNLEDIKVWEWTLKNVDKYTDTEYNYFATGSEYIEDCHRCNAKGWITCTKCHGDKQIVCPTCKGSKKTKCTSCSGSGYNTCSRCGGRGYTGGTQKCSKCNGSGQQYAYESGWDKNVFETCSACGGKGEVGSSVTCSNCRGSGKTQCHSCGGSGKVTCSTCRGQGNITCPQCSGTGRNTCPTCQGKQQLLHYFNIKQTLRTDTQEASMNHSIVHSSFPEFKDNWGEYDSELIFNVRKDKITLEDLPQNTHLEPLFKRHLERADKLLGESEKIIFQDLDIRKIDTWLLNYSFEGRSFSFVFYGKDYTVVPGTNPITEFSSKLMSSGYHIAKKRKYVKAYRLTKQSKDMGVYEQKDTVNKQLDILKGKIKQPYIFGAKVGALFSTLILAYMTLLYCKEINFVFNFAQFINRPTNFLYNLHPWFMAIFATWLIYRSNKLSGKIAFNLFGVIPGSHLRFLLGILVSVITALAITGIILAVNITGLTILISLGGWLGYWVLKIILIIIGLIIGFIIWLVKLIF